MAPFDFSYVLIKGAEKYTSAKIWLLVRNCSLSRFLLNQEAKCIKKKKKGGGGGVEEETSDTY